MKKLLTFLFVLTAFASYSQTGSWTPINGNQRFPKGLGIPVKDTFNIRIEDSAQVVIRPQDGYMWYVYKGSWVKAFAVDTASLSNRINLKLNIGDTAAMLSGYVDKYKTGILYGTGSSVLGNSLMTFANDSLLTFGGYKFLHLDITGQNPGGDDYSTSLGYRAGEVFITGSQGYANTFIGNSAGLNLKSNSASEASSNTLLGHHAGRFLTNTTGSTLLGTGAGDALTTNSTSESVVGVGWHAFNQSTSAFNSVAIGAASLYQYNSVLPSAIVGYRGAFSTTTGGYQSGIGTNIFEYRTSGVRGVGNGAFSGRYSNGDDIVMIGAFTDNNGNGSNLINIGNYTVNSSPGASNEINIGNVIFGKGVSNDSAQNTSAQLGIGVNRSSGIDASAVLQLDNTSKGFLQPRMTEGQRAAISSPATGLQTYVTGTNKIKYYDGSVWRTLVDSSDVANIGPWLVDIDPMSISSSNTNWNNPLLDITMLYSGALNSSGAQNAEVTFPIVLSPGTWTIQFCVAKNTAYGIIDVQIDGFSVGTVDTYNAVGTVNNYESITGINIASNSKKSLKMVMSTKNASSSSYYGVIQHIRLIRTL